VLCIGPASSINAQLCDPGRKIITELKHFNHPHAASLIGSVLNFTSETKNELADS